VVLGSHYGVCLLRRETNGRYAELPLCWWHHNHGGHTVITPMSGHHLLRRRLCCHSRARLCRHW
jgi:hypothetical protein